MEYIEYGNLTDYIKQQGANARMVDAEVITSQILRGLVELHNRNISHRDLNPQVSTIRVTSLINTNSVVEYFDRVSLADMGEDIGSWGSKNQSGINHTRCGWY